MKKRNQSGFTFLELLIVLLVISLIAGIAIPGLLSALKNAGLMKEVVNIQEGIGDEWRKVAAGLGQSDYDHLIPCGDSSLKCIEAGHFDTSEFESDYAQHLGDALVPLEGAGGKIGICEHKYLLICVDLVRDIVDFGTDCDGRKTDTDNLIDNHVPLQKIIVLTP